MSRTIDSDTTIVHYETYNAPQDYIGILADVADLFSIVFGKPFPSALWGQWYLANPYGNPHVAIGRSIDGQLIAHHALVPQLLIDHRGRCLPYFLSVGTMIHQRYRGLKVFLRIVDMLHDTITQTGAAFILAFPNVRSAPLFQNIYGYRPILQTELCNLLVPRAHSGTTQVAGLGLEIKQTTPYTHADNRYWKWRTRANDIRSCVINGTLHLIYKIIAPNTLMVLDLEVNEARTAAMCLRQFSDHLGLTEIRLTRYHANRLAIQTSLLISHDGYVVRLFGLPLAEELPAVRFSLLLSDVF